MYAYLFVEGINNPSERKREISIEKNNLLQAL